MGLQIWLYYYQILVKYRFNGELDELFEIYYQCFIFDNSMFYTQYNFKTYSLHTSYNFFRGVENTLVVILAVSKSLV